MLVDLNSSLLATGLLSTPVDDRTRCCLQDFPSENDVTAWFLLILNVDYICSRELHQMIMDLSISPAYPFYADITAHTHSGTGLNPLSKKRKLDEELTGSGLGSHDQTKLTPLRFFSDFSRHDDVYGLLKKESEAMVQLTDQAKLWLILTFPKFADIHDDLLMELHRAQETALNIRDTARKDLLSRGKICSKLIKYPEIQDYAVFLVNSQEV